MKTVSELMIKAAAEATMPQAGAQDPSMDPAAMIDPIEEDNQRLTNLLNNLQLRSQLIEQQNYLAQLQHDQASKGINARKTMNIQSSQEFSSRNPAAVAANKAFTQSLYEQGILSDKTPSSVTGEDPMESMKAPQKAEPLQGTAENRPTPKS